MHERRRRDDDEREDDEREEASSEPEPLDSGTVSALRQADPHTRARTLLRLQRLHGNAAVERVIRSLQVTDAGRDARVQAIGERAGEPAQRLDRAQLYREAVAAELDASPLRVQDRARAGAGQRQHGRPDLLQLPGGAAPARRRR